MREARCRVLLLLLNDLFTAAFVLAGCLWIYHLMGAYYTLEECVGLWPLVPVMLPVSYTHLTLPTKLEV